MDTGTLALILFGMFALLLIMKVPVSFCLGIAATVCLIILGYPLTVISQKIFTALNSFSIMAIPLFILGGNLMSEGGISKRLTEFCEALVGNIRGGLAIVVILACAFFAALSGSGPATVIAIGSMMYPPSIIMVVYCTMTQVNVASLFSSGFLVGALLIIAMAIIALVQAKKYNWPVTAEKFSWKRVWHSFKHSILALLMPVIVLGGIYSGIFTATEAGAVSCVYALIVAVFIYKTLTWKEVLRIIRDSAVACSVILFIMGTSTVFSWLFTVSGISGWLVSSVTGAGLGYYPILLIITVILLIFGFFLEGIATVSMLLPLFIPIAQAVGIDLLHLGMIVTMTNVMGCMTPPVANNIFAASTFTGLPMGRISKGELPYLGCFFVVLLIVVFCPRLITMFG